MRSSEGSEGTWSERVERAGMQEENKLAGVPAPTPYKEHKSSPSSSHIDGPHEQSVNGKRVRGSPAWRGGRLPWGVLAPSIDSFCGAAPPRASHELRARHKAQKQ